MNFFDAISTCWGKPRNVSLEILKDESFRWGYPPLHWLRVVSIGTLLWYKNHELKEIRTFFFILVRFKGQRMTSVCENLLPLFLRCLSSLVMAAAEIRKTCKKSNNRMMNEPIKILSFFVTNIGWYGAKAQLMPIKRESPTRENGCNIESLL